MNKTMIYICRCYRMLESVGMIMLARPAYDKQSVDIDLVKISHIIRTIFKDDLTELINF